MDVLIPPHMKTPKSNICIKIKHSIEKAFHKQLMYGMSDSTKLTTLLEIHMT